MKYIKQFGIILCFSFIGELLNSIIPLPIPASIYGFVLLLACLCGKVISIESIRETGMLLLSIMPILFVPAAVGIMAQWDEVRNSIIPIISITLISTVFVMAVSGKTTELILRLTEGKERHD